MLLLTSDERAELARRAGSRTLRATDVFKAKLILALADGHSYTRIEHELNTTRPTIARWKARFTEGGLEGLDGRHKGSKARIVTPAAIARLAK